MDVSIEDAEKLFKEAIQTLKEEIPYKAEDCQYCVYIDENNA